MNRFTSKTWIWISVMAVSALFARANADETVTINLPALHPEQEAKPGPVQSQTDQDAQRFMEYSRRRAVKRFPSRGGQSGERNDVTVGRLGIVAHQSEIHASRNTRSRLLSTVPSGTYVALSSQAGEWVGVLMSDKSLGWIRRSSIKFLEYEVTAPAGGSVARGAAQSAMASTQSALLTSGQRGLLQVAYGYLGVPYRYGGSSTSGLDCSAFVQRCFSSLGVNLPRTAHEQIACGLPVSGDQLQAADRIYFASKNGSVTHTGIYIGNGYFIHASSQNKRVVVSSLSEPMYQRMYAGARR